MTIWHEEKEAGIDLLSRRPNFSSRPDIGLESGLIRRLLAWFAGNPIDCRKLTSAGPSAPTGLPYINGMQTAVLFVAGNNINYRVDGQVPTVAGDQQIQAGSTVTLTGIESINAFQFAAVTAVTATVFVTYYD